MCLDCYRWLTDDVITKNFDEEIININNNKSNFNIYNDTSLIHLVICLGIGLEENKVKAKIILDKFNEYINNGGKNDNISVDELKEIMDSIKNIDYNEILKFKN